MVLVAFLGRREKGTRTILIHNIFTTIIVVILLITTIMIIIASGAIILISVIAILIIIFISRSAAKDAATLVGEIDRWVEGVTFTPSLSRPSSQCISLSKFG